MILHNMSIFGHSFLCRGNRNVPYLIESIPADRHLTYGQVPLPDIWFSHSRPIGLIEFAIQSRAMHVNTQSIFRAWMRVLTYSGKLL